MLATATPSFASSTSPDLALRAPAEVTVNAGEAWINYVIFNEGPGPTTNAMSLQVQQQATDTGVISVGPLPPYWTATPRGDTLIVSTLGVLARGASVSIPILYRPASVPVAAPILTAYAGTYGDGRASNDKVTTVIRIPS